MTTDTSPPFEVRQRIRESASLSSAYILMNTLATIVACPGLLADSADDSWLLIRPSGTEPVLRVYAEGRTQQIVRALIGYGKTVAESVVLVPHRSFFPNSGAILLQYQ